MDKSIVLKALLGVCVIGGFVGLDQLHRWETRELRAMIDSAKPEPRVFHNFCPDDYTEVEENLVRMNAVNTLIIQ